jgi:protein-tyrosine phosphatase
MLDMNRVGYVRRKTVCRIQMATWGIAGSFLLATLSQVYGQSLLSNPPRQRHIHLEGAANFRDLGGYHTADGRSIKWGLLYRSDALNALTNDDLRHLATLNVQRVVDFRTATEANAHPDRVPGGLLRESFPVPLEVPKPDLSHVNDRGELDQGAELTWLKAIDRVLVTEAYPSFVRDSTASYRAWMQGLLSAPPGAQIFHCTGGADRTGFGAAILLLALGVPEDTVIRDYLVTNQYLFSPRGRAFLDKRTPVKLPAGLKMHARYLKAAFAEITKEYGSFDGYLRDGLGVDAAARARLRSRYLDDGT